MATRAVTLNPFFFSPSPSISNSSPPSSPLLSLPKLSISRTHHPSHLRSRRLTPPPFTRKATAAEYKFPDPIPEFAEAETSKFRDHMMRRLTKKSEYFGEFVEEIVDICTEILRNFLHSEYGGPGTLLVIPFCDMADAIRERGLPGAPQAARAAVAWAEKHIDKDRKEWTGDDY